MATAKAFGSITIIDVTDIGEFSVYPMSNLPLSVLYSPDRDTYTPSWTSNNLILTPVVYYAGKALTLGESGLSVTWQKMEGITTASMTAGEVTGSTGILTVNKNQFTENSSIITYIVTATYIEPTSGTTLTAQGQISFSLVKMASEAKNVVVNGNNIFKYNSNGVCDIASTTLNVTVTDNLTIKDWEYSNDDGKNWISLNNKVSSLTIAEGSNIFVNDRVLIRAIGEDKKFDTDNLKHLYYDYITVLKLRDGTAAGNSLVLSNESQQIPCGSDGSVTTTAFNLANTGISVYKSGGEVTSEYTITATPNGVIGAWTNSVAIKDKPVGSASVQEKGDKKYFWVTGWTSESDVAEVTFIATKGAEILTKKMSLIKIKTGANGVSPTIYSLDLSDLVVNKSYTYSPIPDSNGNYNIVTTLYSPSSIVVKTTQTTGNDTISYTGYVRVFKNNPEGGEDIEIASGTSNSGQYVLNQIGTEYVPTKYLVFKLYNGSGANDELLDSQTVIITSDGKKGEQGDTGDAGESAINLVLGNYSDIIPVTTAYKPTSETTLTIPFAVYEGTTMISATIVKSNASISFNGTNIAPTSSNNTISSTDSAYGILTYELTTSDVIGASSVRNGSKSLTFTYTTKSGRTGTITGTYSWALTVAPTNGTSTTFLQVYTPKGHVFTNGDGDLDITAKLLVGSTDKTSSATYQWAKYSKKDDDTWDYVNITSGGTSSTLTVNGSTVDSYASYRCTATYSSKSYIGYASLIDKTDPVQVSILSTVGTQIVNGNGVGAFYAVVTRNGKVIDDLKTTNFVTAMPQSMTVNSLYYFIDSSASQKNVKLMKATASNNWVEVTASNPYVGKYKWTYRGADNEVITDGSVDEDGNVIHTPATSGKVVYIDASLINKKITIDVEVEI